MAIHIDWQVSRQASCYHAVAWLAAGGKLADPALEDALVPAASVLWEQLATTHTPLKVFFEHLVPLSASVDGTASLAKQTLTKVVGGHHAERLDAGVAAALATMLNAMDRRLPNLQQELALRAAPLVEQWDARGPGLMHAFALCTEADLAVPAARVLLVHPAVGGHGVAHLWYNSVRIEAVLANPTPGLPEVLRLGWLLAQLQLDLGKYQGDLDRDRLERLGELAMVPALLAAAETVELGTPDEATIELALATWRVECPPHPNLAQALADWWAVYRQSRPSFHTALVALDRFLNP